MYGMLSNDIAEVTPLPLTNYLSSTNDGHSHYSLCTEIRTLYNYSSSTV